MAKRKANRKGRTVKAGSRKAVKARARKAAGIARARTAFSQPFTALQSGVSSFIEYFK